MARVNPALVIPEYIKKVTDMARQMAVRIEHFIALKESRFGGIVEKMASLNPLNILSRGYSLTLLLPDKRILKDAADAGIGSCIQTKLFNGGLISTVTEVRKDGRDQV